MDKHPIGYMDPISKLPNIMDSFVEIEGYDEILKKHDIKKRKPSILHLKTTGDKTRTNYTIYMTSYLNELLVRGDHEKFWNTSLLLMRRSSVFKSIMFWELSPNWHREMNMKEVYMLINKYNTYAEELPRDLKHRRVYLPKVINEQGIVVKYRPLGVPTMAWRLYLHAWQYFLMIYLQKEIPNFQHGFYKGRGTKTAWESVLTKVVYAKSIYEFDLEQFFPSVNASQMSYMLSQAGMPKSISDYLLDVSLSYPRVDSLDESKLDESNALFKAELDSLGLLHTESKPFQQPIVTQPNWGSDDTVKSELVGLLDLDRDTIDMASEIFGGLDGYLAEIYRDRTDAPKVQERVKLILDFRKSPDLFTLKKKQMPDDLYQGKVLKPIMDFINAVTPASNGADVLLERILKEINITEPWEGYFPFQGYTKSSLSGLFSAQGKDWCKFLKLVSSPDFELDGVRVHQRHWKDKDLVLQEFINGLSWECDSLGRTVPVFLRLNTREKATDNRELLKGFMSEDLGYSIKFIEENWYEVLYEYYQVQSALFESFKPNVHRGSKLAVDLPLAGDSTVGKEPGFKVVKEPQVEGLPQGSSISPLLSSFVLAKINEMMSLSGAAPDWIFYADDGLIYSDWKSTDMESYITTFVVPKMEQWGIKMNLAKSGWVKKDGVWDKPLKFLGLTYEGSADGSSSLRASTRKGASLVFDKHEAMMEYANSQILQSQQMSESSGARFYESIRSLNEHRKEYQTYVALSKSLDGILEGDDVSRLHFVETANASLGGEYLIKVAKNYYNKFKKSDIVEILDFDAKHFSWDRIVKSNTFGYILAKLYNNSWNLRFDQDFRLSFKEDS